MKLLEGGLENVPGYTYSAVKADIRYKDRYDYSLIVSDQLCNAAGVFTTNKIIAAPVKICKKRIEHPIKAILINATNANACTADQGYKNALELTSNIAEKLDTDSSSILMSSTGIIGHQLPVEKMMNKHSELIDSLSKDNGRLIPVAIMTTDTIPKEISVSFSTTMGEFRIAGTAKGSGMIAPNMATLLSFIVTDAPLPKDVLNKIFKDVINKTLNKITIDGDMSTNDTAIILSPYSENSLTKDMDHEKFKEALFVVLNKLAKMLVADAEGGSKSVKIIVKGAQSDLDADKAARSVSESLLVKTAIFGKDPNWGRIAAAAGYSGAHIIEKVLSIYYEDIPILVNGTPVDYDKKKLAGILLNSSYSIIIDLNIGRGNAEMITSDLTYDYIKINAEYTT